MKGKVILGVIGTIIGGPVGAAAGLVLGQAIDGEDAKNRKTAQWLFSENGSLSLQCPKCTNMSKWSSTYWQCSCGQYLEFQVSHDLKNIIQRQNIFNEGLASSYFLYLMGCMAGQDGQFSNAEKNFVNLMVKEIGLSAKDNEKNTAIFTHGFKSSDYEFAGRTLGNVFHNSPNIKHGLAMAFLRFAFIEGYIREAELAIAVRLAHFGLGISEPEIKNMLSKIESEMYEDDPNYDKKVG